MSKVIKTREIPESEARWEKYRSEKLTEIDNPQQDDAASGGGLDDPAEIVAAARAEAERIRREAFELGFAEGREQGLSHGASKMQTALSFLKRLAHDLKEVEQTALKQLEPELIKLAVAVAKKIIGKEISVDREIVKQCVARAIEKIVEREKLILYVHPSDLPVVLEYKPHLVEMFDGIKSIEVVASENGISPGGCTVETDLLKANGQVEAQLEEVLQGLLG